MALGICTVFLNKTYNDFKSMDQRVKKAEEGVSTTRENDISAPAPAARKEEVEKEFAKYFDSQGHRKPGVWKSQEQVAEEILKRVVAHRK